MIAYQLRGGREKRFAEGSGLPINISTIELIEIGAGGGSIAAIDTLGLLKVGPQSAGAAPGPACYGRGGTHADRDRREPRARAISMRRRSPAARSRSIARPRKPRSRRSRSKAGLSVAELAWGIHSVVNENMAAAARVHIAERGHHAGEFALLVTGGGGPLHGCEVARRLGITTLVCPPSAGVASALGLLMAPARVDRVATLRATLSRDSTGPSSKSAFAALEPMRAR